MRITVFQSDKGDCLLIRGPGGEHVLADGGMAASYRQHVAPTLARLARAGHALDLVYVSHIDQDHIAGILQLMDDTVAWRRYDYQAQRGNERFKPPASERPPAVRQVWHNVFKDMVADNTGAIEDQLAATMQLANLSPELIHAELAQQAANYEGLVTSIREGLLLAGRLSARQLNIPVNPEFGGGLISMDHQPEPAVLGSLTVRIVGPALADLEKLRQQWNDWLQANQAAAAKIRAESEEEAAALPLTEGQRALSGLVALAAELGRRSAVTIPNLASLMLLVEANGRRLLLTGDGHADDITAGLARRGCLDAEGRLHVDVLKVQHHGSANNLHAAFCRDITADHYVFCGNGAHHNPHLDVVQLLIGTRLADGTQRPFKLWFNSSAQVTKPSYAAHMRALEKLVSRAARRSRGRLRYRFLRRGSRFDVVV